MKYPLTEAIVQSAANFMAQQARYELMAKRPRVSIKAEWKKNGSEWQPTSVSKSKINKNFVASGNLMKSVKPIAKGLEFGLDYAWYGQAIIDGRQPWGKFQGGKGIPVETMNKWIQQRRLKPRNKGKFIGNSDQNKRAMSFMMNRKIKHFGIEPFDFVKMPRQITINKFLPLIKDAISKDIKNEL
jgi:hypothetical protein